MFNQHSVSRRVASYQKGWEEESGNDYLKGKDYSFATLVSGSGAE